MRYRLSVPAVVAVVLASMSLTGASASAPKADRSARSPVAATPITPNGDWHVYHRDDGHTGYDASAPAATGAVAGWTSVALDENIYASPLVYGGIVYVATLNNSVYALNQTDGSVVWSNNLGAPETTGWQCGNAAPQGILGTPVIDPGSGRIYVVTLQGSDDLYRVVGLNLNTGTAEFSQVITTQALTGFDWTIQQERGALGFRNGYVYVPFGGRAGDCGSYHGWIFAVPINGGTILHYVTPGIGAGFWNAGGMVIDDVSGDVFNTSGNGTGSGCAANGDGTPTYENDAVVVWSPTLQHLNAFWPQDWESAWCTNDQDLGSASMVLINPRLAFQAGKWGNGFLLDPQMLGAQDGQLYPTPKPASYGPVDVCYGNHSDANFGSYAYAAPFVYLSCDGHGLVGLQVNTTAPVSFSGCDATCAAPTWNAGGTTSFGPPIVAGGVVWAVSTGGGGLYGFSASNGAQIYHSAGFGATHFTTLAEAGGQLFVGSGSVLRSFSMVSGCRTVTAVAGPASPQSVGTAVTVTAAAGSCPNANPQYEFWLRTPGGACCQLAQTYGTGNVYNWRTSGLTPGNYTFAVWAKDALSSGAFANTLGRYDAYFIFTYTLNPASCSSVTASALPASPQNVGTAVTITATGSGCPDANPQFEFWIRPPNAACCQLAQAYGATNAYNWSTTGLQGGVYTFAVWVKDANSNGLYANGLGRYDAYSVFTFTLNGTPCTGVTATSSPNGTASRGTPVTITGTASGCPNARYQFELLAPGSQTWQVVQAYGASNTLTWNTTNAAKGTYRLIVKVRDASSSGTAGTGNPNGAWDAYTTILYTLI